MKPADVRFYFDADILGLGKLVARLRSDCTFPGDPGATIHKRVRPPCIVTGPQVDDRDWIPEVTKQGLVIITRDARISRRPAEKAAVMVSLSSQDARSTWNQLEVLLTQWRAIERLHGSVGPRILRASRSKLIPVEL